MALPSMKMFMSTAILHFEPLRSMSNLTLDRTQYQAEINGKTIVLNHVEFELLWVLSAFSGRSITHQRLVEHLEEHDVSIHTDHVLSSLISLKEKIPQPRRLGLLGGRAMLI